MAIAPLMAVISVVSGIVGAIGSMSAAQAQADAAEKNAQIAEYNASVARRNEATTLAVSRSEQMDSARQHTRQLSAIRAAYGTSGLAFEGSPLDVLEDTALEQSLDESKIGYKGKLKAIGYQDEAVNYKMKAELSRMEAESAKTAGMFGAATAFLGGVSGAGKTMMRAA